MIGPVIASRMEAERELFQIYRKGIVEAIDKTQTTYPLWMVKIRGRWMPFVDESVAVGDLVFYDDDFNDPFAWVRVDLVIDGGGKAPTLVFQNRVGLWYEEDYLFATGYDTMLEPLYAAFPPPSTTVRWTSGVAFMAHAYEQTTASMVGIHYNASPNGWTDPATHPQAPYQEITRTVHYQDDNGLTFVSGTDLGDGNLGPTVFEMSGYSFQERAPGSQFDWNIGRMHVDHFVVPGCPSIRDLQISDYTVLPANTKLYFPDVVAPGPNWPLLFMFHLRVIDNDTPGGGTSTKGRDNSDVVSFPGGFNGYNNNGDFRVYTAVSLAPGVPEVWVQFPVDVEGRFMSAILTADPAWFA